MMCWMSSWRRMGVFVSSLRAVDCCLNGLGFVVETCLYDSMIYSRRTIQLESAKVPKSPTPCYVRVMKRWEEEVRY